MGQEPEKVQGPAPVAPPRITAHGPSQQEVIEAAKVFGVPEDADPTPIQVWDEQGRQFTTSRGAYERALQVRQARAQEGERFAAHSTAGLNPALVAAARAAGPVQALGAGDVLAHPTPAPLEGVLLPRPGNLPPHHISLHPDPNAGGIERAFHPISVAMQVMGANPVLSAGDRMLAPYAAPAFGAVPDWRPERVLDPGAETLSGYIQQKAAQEENPWVAAGGLLGSLGVGVITDPTLTLGAHETAGHLTPAEAPHSTIPLPADASRFLSPSELGEMTVERMAAERARRATLAGERAGEMGAREGALADAQGQRMAGRGVTGGLRRVEQANPVRIAREQVQAERVAQARGNWMLQQQFNEAATPARPVTLTPDDVFWRQQALDLPGQQAREQAAIAQARRVAALEGREFPITRAEKDARRAADDQRWAKYQQDKERYQQRLREYEERKQAYEANRQLPEGERRLMFPPLEPFPPRRPLVDMPTNPVVNLETPTPRQLAPEEAPAIEVAPGRAYSPKTTPTLADLRAEEHAATRPVAEVVVGKNRFQVSRAVDGTPVILRDGKEAPVPSQGFRERAERALRKVEEGKRAGEPPAAPVPEPVTPEPPLQQAPTTPPPAQELTPGTRVTITNPNLTLDGERGVIRARFGTDAPEGGALWRVETEGGRTATVSEDSLRPVPREGPAPAPDTTTPPELPPASRPETPPQEPTPPTSSRLTTERIDPNTVQTDAKTYQYKAGGDSSGVTGRHDVDVQEARAGAATLQRNAPAAPRQQAPAPTPPAARPAPAVTPAPTRPPAQLVRSRKVIFDDLTNAFKTNVAWGTKKARVANAGGGLLGRFHNLKNLVEVVRRGDFPTRLHELAHRIDQTEGLSRGMSAQAKAGLEHLADPTLPNSRSSWRPGQPLTKAHGEGFGEFLRLWLDDPASLPSTPQVQALTREFEQWAQGAGDPGTVLLRAKKDLEIYRNAEPWRRVHAQFADTTRRLLPSRESVVEAVTDDLLQFRLLDEAAMRGGRDLAPHERMYVLASNHRGLGGVIESFNGSKDLTGKIHGGGLKATVGADGAISRTPIPGVKSLAEILEPFRKSDEDYFKFRAYAIARAAEDVIAQGKHFGLPVQDVTATVRALENEPGFRQAFDELQKSNRAVLEYARDLGYLTDEDLNRMLAQNGNYLPIHRLYELGVGQEATSRAGTGAQLGEAKPASLKRRKGMQAADDDSLLILDPFETLAKNNAAIIQQAERNAIGQMLLKRWEANSPGIGRFVMGEVNIAPNAASTTLRDLRAQLQRAGADLTNANLDEVLNVFTPDTKAPWGENVVRVRGADGKYRFLRLSEDFHTAWHGLDQDSLTWWARGFGSLGALKRAGITLDTVYQAFNLFRDTFEAGTTSRTGGLKNAGEGRSFSENILAEARDLLKGGNPLSGNRPIQNFLKGTATRLFDPAFAEEWHRSGGSFGTYVSQTSPAAHEAALRQMVRRMGPVERASLVLPDGLARRLGVGATKVTSPLEVMRAVQQVFEEMTRLGEAKAVYQQERAAGRSHASAMTGAAFESRKTLDFSQKGAQMRSARSAIPFLGARITGLDRMYRSLAARPLTTSIRALTYVTLPTLLLEHLNSSHDPAYDNLSDVERWLMWHVPKNLWGLRPDGGSGYWRLPKPQGIGWLFGSLPQFAFRRMQKKDPESAGRFAASMLDGMTPVSAQAPYVPVPPAILTTLELASNYDFFRQRPIENLGDMRFSPEMRSSEWTSLTARTVGKALHVSPKMVEHAMVGFMGTLTRTVADTAIDPAIAAAGGGEVGKRASEGPLKALFGRASLDEPQLQPVDDFYRTYQHLKQRSNDAKAGGKRLSGGEAQQWARVNSAKSRVDDIQDELRAMKDPGRRRQKRLQLLRVVQRALGRPR